MKYWPLIWRNLARNPLRSALTGGAIALAVALVCLLLSMPAGFDSILESVATNTRVGMHAKAGLVYSVPLSYLQKLRAMPGVVAATSYDWFGGAVDPDRGVEFPSFSVDPDAIGTVFKDYASDPAALGAFARKRDAALVSPGLLAKQGWKVGDRISLDSTRYGFALEFQIVGTLKPPGSSENNPVFWFSREYLEQTLESRGEPGADQMSMAWALVDDATRVEPLLREIDEYFRNSEVQTASETEKSFVVNFFGVLDGLVTVILIVTGLVALCIVFIAANTASMSVRERMRELAVLKALGFSRRVIFGTLLFEATLLSTLAGGIGALASLSLTSALRSFAGGSPELGPLANFVVGPWILGQGLFLALFVGMISGVVPSLGAARRSVVATLREVF